MPAGSCVFEKIIGKSAFVNPRRYGAMTWQDHARAQLSIFTREEAGAIVAFLEYKRDADPEGLNHEEINAALDSMNSGARVRSRRRRTRRCSGMSSRRPSI
jgi:hypothetical protein